jgi:hypothetical protein
MVLREYLACMDSADPATALDLMEPDLQFLIALPDDAITGVSKDDFAKYITGRNAVRRSHQVLRYAVDGDTEMVYGAVVEGGRRAGLFHSASVTSPNGRMARYQSFFTPNFALIDQEAP